jgi:hypothetical protein
VRTTDGRPDRTTPGPAATGAPATPPAAAQAADPAAAQPATHRAAVPAAGSPADAAAAPGGSAAAAPGGSWAAGLFGRERAGDPVVVRVAAGVLIAVLALGLALVEAFLVPLRIGTVPLPVCVPLAMAGNIVLAKLAVRQTGSIAWGAAPPVLWLVVVVVLSLPRSEGDLVVPGTLTGLVFLFAGAIAGAYGVASEITRRAGAAARTRR